MLDKLKFNKFINQINFVTTDNHFKDTLEKLILQMKDMNYNSTISYSNYKKRGYLILTGRKNNQEYDLKIIINNNDIEFAFCSDNSCYNKFGKFYKTENHEISKLCDYKIIKHENYNEMITNQEISVFNDQSIETFKYTLNDCQNYQIKDGKKVFIQNNDLAFESVLNIRKQIRTKSDNLINIEEKSYYNDNMKEKNNVEYSIGYNYSYGEKYIPYGGEFSIIPKQKYLDFITGVINEKELFENYKIIKHVFIAY